MWMAFIVPYFTKCIFDYFMYSDYSFQEQDKFIYEKMFFPNLCNRYFFIFWEAFLLL